MDIVKTNVLTKSQQSQIKALEDLCFAADGLECHAFLSNELNFDRNLDCFFLGYENGEPVAFLSVFAPSRAEAEVQAVTRPDCRRQGCFRALLGAAKTEIIQAGVEEIVFAVETKSASGSAVVKRHPSVRLLRSEYRMTRRAGDMPACPENLDFVMVDSGNIAHYRRLITSAFPEMKSGDVFFDRLLQPGSRTGYLAFENGSAVGGFCLNFEGTDVFLYGLAIAEDRRGRGIGTRMTAYALKKGFEKADRVILEVDSGNPAALRLYHKCGFAVDFQVDYFACAAADA